MTNEAHSDSGLVLKVVRDEDPPNPRTDWDNLSVMAMFHRRYTLGDEGHGLRTEDFGGWGEMEEFLYKQRDAAIVMPVYMIDHSGISISTKPFACPWDSGQVGFIYVTREQAREWFNCQRVTKKLRQRLTEALEAEVKVYDQYLTGDVWGFEVETKTGRHVESCYGFFGEAEARSEGEYVLKICQSAD